MAGTVPLLPLEEGQAENSCFLFLSVLPTFKKKSSFLFLQVTSLSILTLIRGRNASWIIHQGRGYAIQFTLSCARRLQPSWQKMQLSQSLQPVGALGQLGKEQALPCAENPFSQHGVGLGLHDGANYRAQSVLKFLQRQDSGTTETISEAPGAYGIHSRCHAARTPSALVTQPSPEMGMAP